MLRIGTLILPITFLMYFHIGRDISVNFNKWFNPNTSTHSGIPIEDKEHSSKRPNIPSVIPKARTYANARCNGVRIRRTPGILKTNSIGYIHQGHRLSVLARTPHQETVRIGNRTVTDYWYQANTVWNGKQITCWVFGDLIVF